jgi:myo-inositol-1(or 4)-monophosphatase
VSKTTELSDATMILTNPRELYSETHGEQLQRLAKRVRLVRGFGDCYGYYLVATGLADMMVEPGQLKYYDVAPMPPILAGAGGLFTDLSGKVDFLNGQGLATTPQLHEQILRTLNPV